VLLKTFVFQGQKTHYNDYKLLLNTVQVQEQVPPKMITGNSFAPSKFGDTSHMPTIQYLKVKIRNTYLTFINGSK
jgi:hypothetical protein